MNPIPARAAKAESRESWGPLLGLATREVFERMLGSSLTEASDPCAEAGLDITAMVGLAGQMCGILTVRCTMQSARHMASKMLGVEPVEAGPEMSDAIGEVCNMVAGNFKNKLAGMGDGCMLSVPTVIIGADYQMRALADLGKTEISLLFEDQPLVISLQIHS